MGAGTDSFTLIHESCHFGEAHKSLAREREGKSREEDTLSSIGIHICLLNQLASLSLYPSMGIVESYDAQGDHNKRMKPVD